jgi:hypothetical protein
MTPGSTDAAAAEVEAAVAAVEAREAEGEEVRGVAVAPGEAAIARQPGVGVVLGAVPDLEAALDQVEARDPVVAVVAEAARVPASDPVVAADFVAASPGAREAAEELAAQDAAESVADSEAESVPEIDRQHCRRVATSPETDRAVSEIGPVASAELGVSEIAQVPSADPVASVGLAASDARVASAAPVVLPIAPEPVLEIDPVSEQPSEPALERGLQIDLEEATAPSWATMSETVETDSAIVAISRTIGAIGSRIAAIVSKTARRIAVIVAKTVRRTEVIVSKTVAIGSKTVAIGWRTAATESKTGVIGWKTPATGPITPRTIGGTFTTIGTTAPGTATGDMAPAGTTTRGPLGVSVPQRGD